MALDSFTRIFSGNSGLDMTPEEKQKLMDMETMPATELNNPLWRGSSLPEKYVKDVVIPAIKGLSQAQLIALDDRLKNTKTELSDLVADIREATVYVPATGGSLPVPQSTADRVKAWADGYVSWVGKVTSDIANLGTEQEKEDALLGGIITSANRGVVMFDQYILAWDGVKYGDKANDWFEVDSWNRNIREPQKAKTISHNVENVSKPQFSDVLNEVVAMAKDKSLTIPWVATPFKSRIDKLKYLATWMDALEEGCNKVLPNLAAQLAAEAAATATKWVVGTSVWAIWGFTGYMWDEYYPWILGAGAVIWFSLYKAGTLGVGLGKVALSPLWLPALGFEKAAGLFTKTQWAVPHIKRLADALSLKNMEAPMRGAGGTAATEETGTPGPKTPGNYVDSGLDLPDFNPWSDKHKEYTEKTIAHIKDLGVTPSIPVTPLTVPPTFTTVNATEVANREVAFRALDSEYRSGKMSTSEFVTRTEDIIKGKRGIRQVLVVDDATGKVKKGDTLKEASAKIADKLAGGRLDSQAKSVGAIARAKERIRGHAFVSQTLDGTKIEFPDAESRQLFDKFRDTIERYAQMQEWAQNDAQAIAMKEQLKSVQLTDIPAKKAEILTKQAHLATITSTAATIPGPPMWNPPMPTYIANPLIANISAELGLLDGELKVLNAQVATLNKEIHIIEGKQFNYRPSDGLRGTYEVEVNTLRGTLGTPSDVTIFGIIDKINTKIDPLAKTIPDTFFNPTDLKVTPVRMIDFVAKALKK